MGICEGNLTITFDQLNGGQTLLAQVRDALKAAQLQIANLTANLGTVLDTFKNTVAVGIGGVSIPSLSGGGGGGGSSLQRPVLTPIPIPVIPDVALPDFSYTYSSQLLNKLVFQLTTSVQNGGTGIPSNVQDAMARLALNKREKAALEKLDAIEARHEALGWNLATGALLEDRHRVFNDLSLAAQEDSDKILVDSYNLAQTNTWQGWQLGTATEKARMEFEYKAAMTAVERANAILALTKAIIDEALGVAKIISLWNKDLTGFYQAQGSYVIAMAEASVIVYEAAVRANIAISKLILQGDQAAADCAIEIYKIVEKAAETLARAAAQVAAAAIGANTHSASLLTQESTSDSQVQRTSFSMVEEQVQRSEVEVITHG